MKLEEALERRIKFLVSEEERLAAYIQNEPHNGALKMALGIVMFTKEQFSALLDDLSQQK